jgi:dTDP-4-dehydrorhamnose 3,5-epimerase
MRFRATIIPQLFVLEIEPQADLRGFFARAWCSEELAAHGLTSRCLQANLTGNSQRGTLRGMHVQLPPHGDSKCVRVIRGSIHDVVLDLREDSPTFQQWFACELSAENRRSLLIPEGCAHGYLTLTDDTELFYLHSARYDPTSSSGIHWNSGMLAGAWPFAPRVVSERDQGLPLGWPSRAA